MTDIFQGKAAPLTQGGFDQVAQQLGGDACSLWSLLTVETKGFGFLPNRRPKILFERHIFSKRTNHVFDAAHPDISNTAPGGYAADNAKEYDRLAAAMQLNEKAALESASWGLGQIMGFNATSLGYSDVTQMISLFCAGEDQQLDGVRRFLMQSPKAAAGFRNQQWDDVAAAYNGPNYAINKYDEKLKQYHDAYKANGTPDIEIRAAQARLTFLGIDPHGVDGKLGNGTRAALTEFQKRQGLPASGQLDATTAQALKTAAGV